MTDTLWFWLLAYTQFLSPPYNSLLPAGLQLTLAAQPTALDLATGW